MKTNEYKYTGKEKIGINFCDNDFGYSVKNFMESIIANLEFSPTKEQIVEIYNSSIYGFYLAFQNQFKYGEPDHNDFLKNKYLKISVDNVFIGKEVQEYIDKNNGWCNSEFLVTDNGYTYYV